MLVQMQYLGDWSCSNNTLLVSDPCYNKPSDTNKLFQLNIIISNVVNGKWKAYILKKEYSNCGQRIHTLLTHINSVDSFDSFNNFKKIGSAAVDSGQLGIFDIDHYPNDDTGDFGDNSTFYGKCCNQTLSDIGAGIVKSYDSDCIGVVASSGIGDGFYGIYVHYDKDGYINGIMVDFL